MASSLIAAIDAEKGKEKRIKLVNGEIVKGKIMSVDVQAVVMSASDAGAGSPKFTIPLSSILYVSDCQLGSI